MKKNSKTKFQRETSLLLCYDQTLLFSSIEEILIYASTIVNRKMNSKIYPKGFIDEYNRVILKANIEVIRDLKTLLDDYGIKTIIGELDDKEFRVERTKYISYKFPHLDWQKVEREWKEKYLKGEKVLLNHEPIILNVPIENNEYYAGIIFIAYRQFKTWNEVVNSCLKVNNMFFKNQKNFDISTINKYNRVFVRSNQLELLKQIENEFKKEGILTIRLHRENEFVPYRYEYIKKYYGEQHVSYLHQKWKLEYLNGWFNKEKWNPVIPVK